ncbi:hypothetical protein PPK14_gp12 [Bacillus phage vB_BspS_SplendidRed]|uniref:Uncharacterized protein n=1 Tax=Bacillus phage vB_BspS_SplendidRed TaxID=2591379 RepID=A0A5B9NLT9_9CAUD|nr:hypothetical protein PPK14_gp12 [Bacillus phage vB_BspS_SplendidRed]QEG13486.1 hypothetical protein SPLENDIDRED_12 [Bacillus phage vB_BspS_SplendidRed]
MKKFYEVQNPYYALIKADSLEEAEKIYNAGVAYTSDIENFKNKEIALVGYEYALVKIAQEKDGAGELKSPKAVISEYLKQESGVILLDGALI